MQDVYQFTKRRKSATDRSCPGDPGLWINKTQQEYGIFSGNHRNLAFRSHECLLRSCQGYPVQQYLSLEYNDPFMPSRTLRQRAPYPRIQPSIVYFHSIADKKLAPPSSGATARRQVFSSGVPGMHAERAAPDPPLRGGQTPAASVTMDHLPVSALCEKNRDRCSSPLDAQHRSAPSQTQDHRETCRLPGPRK